MPKIFIIFCFFSFYSEILAHSLKIFAKDEEAGNFLSGKVLSTDANQLL